MRKCGHPVGATSVFAFFILKKRSRRAQDGTQNAIGALEAGELDVYVKSRDFYKTS